MYRLINTLCASVCMMYAGQTTAITIRYELYSEYTESNNILFEDTATDNEELDQSLLQSGIRLNFDGISQSTQYRLDADFHYMDYSENVAEDVERSELEFEMVNELRPGSVYLNIVDNLSQTSIDYQLPFVEGNIQSVNYISIGPRFTWPVTRSDNLELNFDFVDYSYEITNNDNKRAQQNFTWLKDVITNFSFRANQSVSLIRFDDENIASSRDQDSIIYDLGMIYSSRTSRISASYGQQVISIENGQEYNNDTYQLEFNRRANRKFQLGIEFSRRARDQSDVVALGGTAITGSFVEDRITTELVFRGTESTIQVIGNSASIDSNLSEETEYTKNITLQYESVASGEGEFVFLLGRDYRRLESTSNVIESEYENTRLRVSYRFVLGRNMDITTFVEGMRFNNIMNDLESDNNSIGIRLSYYNR